jgi:hypothetical protein
MPMRDDANAPANNVLRGSFPHSCHFARSAADQRNWKRDASRNVDNARHAITQAERSDSEVSTTAT